MTDNCQRTEEWLRREIADSVEDFLESNKLSISERLVDFIFEHLSVSVKYEGAEGGIVVVNLRFT